MVIFVGMVIMTMQTVSCLSVDAAMCVEGIIGMVRYIKKKRVETSRRGVAMGDIEKEIHILAEMENENIIYLHQVPQKSHSSSSLSLADFPAVFF